MDLVSQFELQAKACDKLGSPLYGSLLREIARDIAEHGPCAEILAGYEDIGFDAALPLRLLAGVHALVLSGGATDLAPFYPSSGATVRPSDPAEAWIPFRQTVIDNPGWIRDWLTRPPQTNEVGRAVPLLAGLLAAVDAYPLPVRLLELGASGGLNLRADHFRWESGDIGWGPQDSPVCLTDAWRGEVPEWLTGAVRRNPHLTVVERRGCDPTPLDPLSPRDSLALRSYVWPDQLARAARLDGALRLAEKIPVDITVTGARNFLADTELQPGSLTVVWHSVMRQYVDPAEWHSVTTELDRLAAASGPDTGFACVAFEPQNSSDDRHGFRLTVRIGANEPVILARAMPHGLPAFEWAPDLELRNR
ncbi:DUF2332 domain-containing protein [Nocardia macrotermitis]|uniref:DUF2332 domain-containing protein n=1 Tax=Nocardia macrotermitis TaxID=2585198 RepID=A0A7K0DF86_9NOCA|nr:DUF2332 domain-containing protein [Nocardia macrotermitis]MQY24191.1 hypothetical protein [Nocardia macrotermitis]